MGPFNAHPDEKFFHQLHSILETIICVHTGTHTHTHNTNTHSGRQKETEQIKDYIKIRIWNRQGQSSVHVIKAFEHILFSKLKWEVMNSRRFCGQGLFLP